MQLILFWLQVMAVSSLSALSGAGYALSFSSLSGTDVATLLEPMDCTEPYWPRESFGLSMWMRCLQSNDSYSCGVPLAFQRWSGTTYTPSYFLFGPEPLSRATTGAKIRKVIAVIPTSLRPTLDLPQGWDIFKWHHWHMQWTGSPGIFTTYLDGARIGTARNVLIDPVCKDQVSPTLVVGSIFGKPMSSGLQTAGGGFQGQVDEVCVWNRSLSQGEILDLTKKKLSGSEPGLVLYYDMNEPSGSVVKNLAFTGPKYDLLLGRTKETGGFVDAKRQVPMEFTRPTFSPSGIPIESPSPRLCFPVSKDEFYSLRINSSADNLTLTSTPLYGELWNTLDGINPDGLSLQPGTNVTHPEGLVIFRANVTFSQDNFTIDVGGVSGLVSLLYSTPGVQESIALKVTPPVNISLSPKFDDPLGLGGTIKIVGFPEAGQLWNWNNDGYPDPSSPINESFPMVTHPSGLFQYYTEAMFGENITYVYVNEAGVESDPQLFSTTLGNVLPIVAPQSYSVSQNNRQLIQLDVSDVNGDAVSTTILEFPSHGSLYYARADNSMGDVITGVLNPNQPENRVTSYATKILGLSSYKTDEVLGAYLPFGPNETLGPQDVFTYGAGSTHAMQFNTINGMTNGTVIGGIYPLNYTYDPNTWYTKYGYTEFVEWEFGEEAAYVYQVLIGMSAGTGSIVNIKAWSPEGWKSIWHGNPDPAITATRAYWRFLPPICQTNYKTNRLRVEYNTRNLGEFALTDYVSLVGLKQTLYGALEYNVTKLYYVPDRNYVGPDSFKIRSFDCPYSDAFSTDAVIHIDVIPVPQPPIISSENTTTVSLDSAAAIHLKGIVYSGESVFFTIYSLPSVGKLKDGDDVIDSVPYNVTRTTNINDSINHSQNVTGTISYVSDKGAWNREANVSFNYSATGFLEADRETITIQLYTPAPETPIMAWLVIFAISALCTPSYLLVIFRRNKYPIRTRSLTTNLLITTATVLSLNIPIYIIKYGRDYSCSWYYWSYMLFPSLLTLGVVLALFRQRSLFHLEKLKTILSGRGSKIGLASRSAVITDVNFLKTTTSEGFTFAVAIIGIVLVVIIAASCISVANQTVGIVYCQMAPVISNWLIVNWAISSVAVGWGLYSIISYIEGTGFHQSIFYFLIAELSFGILYIILVSVSTDQFESYALLLCLIPLVYQGLGILSPCFYTFECLRSVELDGILPFQDIIVTHNGFAWFLEFCKSEFSLENPMCWKEIQNFKNKTSYAAMRNIHDKYFAHNAPLAVNIGSHSLEKIHQACGAMTEQSSLYELQTIFDVVQIELLRLMQEDSYRRFLGSEYYMSFRKGDPPPKQNEISLSSSQGGRGGPSSLADEKEADSFMGTSRSRASPSPGPDAPQNTWILNPLADASFRFMEHPDSEVQTPALSSPSHDGGSEELEMTVS